MKRTSWHVKKQHPPVKAKGKVLNPLNIIKLSDVNMYTTHTLRHRDSVTIDVIGAL